MLQTILKLAAFGFVQFKLLILFQFRTMMERSVDFRPLRKVCGRELEILRVVLCKERQHNKL